MAKGTVDIIRTLIATAGLIVVMIAFGTKLGRAEKGVEVICETMTGIIAEQDYLKKNVSQIETKQAYQEGVVNTKLENLEKGIQRIEDIISLWEPN